jgi:hypothetical protein
VADTSDPASGLTWHPILATREPSPGVWQMVDDLEHHYALIRLVRRGDELGYRVDRTDAAGSVTGLVGFYTTLMTATYEAHMAFVRSHGAPDRTSYGA